MFIFRKPLIEILSKDSSLNVLPKHTLNYILLHYLNQLI